MVAPTLWNAVGTQGVGAAIGRPWADVGIRPYERDGGAVEDDLNPPVTFGDTPL